MADLSSKSQLSRYLNFRIKRNKAIGPAKLKKTLKRRFGPMEAD